ncbi:hypothetical protein NEMBOFW57_009712 [Staphylotrichum longicolle]|uniref:Uncharacterized protein n=1 Tax=Staphylotrichum longicolle TaxID=669026 RepID=A0AAD4HUZ3_9PEZI|nr:hypothetical protein NEMBOFW57_009712 [Staphylotrichum longicolle]
MHRVKYSERVRLLDTQIQKAQDEINESAEVVVTAMLNAAPRQNGPMDAASKMADSAVTVQQQEVAAKQEAEISELKSKVHNMEARHTQDMSELKAEFSRQFEEMNRQMEELVKGVRKDEGKALKSLKEDVTGEMKEVVKEVKKDIIKEVKTMNATEEMEQKIRAMRENSAAKNSFESNSTLDPAISTLIQQESQARQSEISGLIRRVDEQHGQLVQHTQEIAALRGSQATCAQQVEEHETRLSSLDTDALEEAAETVSIKVPDLQRTVAGIQTTLNQTTENLRGVDVPGLQRAVADVQARLDDIPREVDSRQQALDARVREVVKNMGDVLGSTLDEVEGSVTKHDKRLRDLEELASVGRLVPDMRQAQAADVELGSTGIASFKPDYDMTKATVVRLTQESESINGQLEMLRQSFTGLDSQFNNLTTRALAECIIGHLEQLYPNSRQLSADVDGLKTATLGLDSRVGSLEGLLQGFKGKADGFADTEFNGAKVSSNVLKDVDENTRPGNKRKRSDLGSNGMGHHVMGNGTDPTSGRM